MIPARKRMSRSRVADPATHPARRPPPGYCRNPYRRVSSVHRHNHGTRSAETQATLPFSGWFGLRGVPRSPEPPGSGRRAETDGDSSQTDRDPLPAGCSDAARGDRCGAVHRLEPFRHEVLLLLRGRVPLHRRLLQPRTGACDRQRGPRAQGRRRSPDRRGAPELRLLDGYAQPLARIAEGVAHGPPRAARRTTRSSSAAADRHRRCRFIPARPQRVEPPRAPLVCACRLSCTDHRPPRWTDLGET